MLVSTNILFWICLCFMFIFYILESLKHKLLYKLSYMYQPFLHNYLKISNIVMVFTKAYVLCHINTSVSSWGHFLNDTTGLTCKQTSKGKHSISTENTWWQCNKITGQQEQIKICRVLNSFKEASSPEISVTQRFALYTHLSMSASFSVFHPSLRR